MAALLPPAVFDFLDAEPKVEYVVAMASNAVLDRRAEEALEVARLCAGLTQDTEHIYDETLYAARSWEHSRRVVIKAEVVQGEGKEPRDNPRFVVTNMKQSPKWIYEEVYCQRANIENRIKELKALDVDRTSCTRFWANQLRVLMTAAAYVLMQEVRLAATLTAMARAQVWTLRERLIKLGARVVCSVRRLVVHLPESFPLAQRVPDGGPRAGRYGRIRPLTSSYNRTSHPGYQRASGRAGLQNAMADSPRITGPCRRTHRSALAPISRSRKLQRQTKSPNSTRCLAFVNDAG